MAHCSYLELILLMHTELLKMLYLIFLVQGSKSSKPANKATFLHTDFPSFN